MAPDLLDPRRNNHSISEVAFSLGFNDAAHFSRAFRRCFGRTPSEWRQLGGKVPQPEALLQPERLDL
ncbi:MAG: helix-turn-helix domain-containing protein [Candidatus Accumulibacter sp.]|nr:helix-turn-helix domain-containing protein [Accumulibacter sp.]